MSEIKLFSIKNDVKQLIPSEVLLEGSVTTNG